MLSEMYEITVVHLENAFILLIKCNTLPRYLKVDDIKFSLRPKRNTDLTKLFKLLGQNIWKKEW